MEYYEEPVGGDKTRKIYRNRKAVSNVVGTILMLGIIVPAITVYSVCFIRIIDTQMDMMERFEDRMDEKYNSPTSDIVNHAPSITNGYPSDGDINIELQPMCYVYVNDNDGDNLTVSFFEYLPTSLSWEKTNETIFCGSDTTVYWEYTHADRLNRTYSWYVAAYDGITVTRSEVYSFKTIRLDDDPGLPPVIP